MPSAARNYYLPLIVFSQFTGTSLWFAGNAVISSLQEDSGSAVIAGITSFVQFGFITGTLVFAVLTVADRFKSGTVFFISSCIAALANLLIIFNADDLTTVSTLRFITGFFLAGIYPVGMKIAADLFPGKLGNALGFLVGALVFGTAFPYLLRSQMESVSWKYVLVSTSVLAFIGGLLVYLFIPSRKTLIKNGFYPQAFLKLFRLPDFRSAAFGYFGHMWELYTVWAFIPLIIARFNATQSTQINVPLWSFLFIAAGGVGCIVGGLFSIKYGSRKVALILLAVSGACCLIAPFIFQVPAIVFLTILFIWGFTVSSDSPQFSSLVAGSALPDYKGTALTFVTSIGFSITIASIQLMQSVFDDGNMMLWILVPGPFFGIMAMVLRKQKRPVDEQAHSVIAR